MLFDIAGLDVIIMLESTDGVIKCDIYDLDRKISAAFNLNLVDIISNWHIHLVLMDFACQISKRMRGSDICDNRYIYIHNCINIVSSRKSALQFGLPFEVLKLAIRCMHSWISEMNSVVPIYWLVLITNQLTISPNRKKNQIRQELKSNQTEDVNGNIRFARN